MEGKWVRFQLNNFAFLVRSCFFHGRFQFHIFDGIYIWEQELSADDLLSTSNRLNSQFEMEVELIKETLKDLTCTQLDRAKYSYEYVREEELVIRMEIPKFSFQYKWEFRCRKSGPQVLAQNLISPLLVLTSELQRRIIELKVHCLTLMFTPGYDQENRPRAPGVQSHRLVLVAARNEAFQ